ncbi:hypothetical protein NDU88_002450 [Pleurodeles waltl]|uniref:SAM-dependent MTase RsmB/NOP-type domain-containing protein n=1 Tax=Pleurodeles waltl TaxID=8319 RepID=A0AAV7WSD5_PLEWA|nr:hypothetical protein NDU88_002450 [Pleurodeles waltl]
MPFPRFYQEKLGKLKGFSHRIILKEGSEPKVHKVRGVAIKEALSVKLSKFYKTKLAAALARCRIKYDALTIDYILPETVRSQERRAFTIPLYAWVNTAKISVNDICYALKMEGFTKVNSVVDLEGYSFCVDENCKDVLAFPPNLKDELVNMKLFTTYKLILQDKSQSLAVHSVSALMNLDDDIIVTNMYSGLTVAHMSTLTNQYTCNIFVCGIKSASKEAELQDFFTHMECKNVKLFQENFTDIHPTDPRFHKAKVILLQPQCSGSGVCDPVEFILNEHGDTDLLQDFSQGSVAEEKLNALSNRQLLEMVHAMKFNKVQAIVYYTCSVYKEENEDVVKKALEFRVDENKHHAYRLSPPVVPLCYSSEMISASNKFFKVEPSDISNGCFLAVLTRERDPSEAVSVKDVLARAAAKGLLEGVELTKHSKRDERKKKYKTSGQKVASSTTVSQAKITEFINKESLIANAKVSPSKTISEIPRNAANQVNNSSQLKKSLKHTSNSGTTEHGIAKTKNSLSTVSKMFEKQTSTGKPKSEDKLIVLKPVEILLPPVMGRRAHSKQRGRTGHTWPTRAGRQVDPTRGGQRARQRGHQSREELLAAKTQDNRAVEDTERSGLEETCVATSRCGRRRRQAWSGGERCPRPGTSRRSSIVQGCSLKKQSSELLRSLHREVGAIPNFLRAELRECEARLA